MHIDMIANAWSRKTQNVCAFLAGASFILITFSFDASSKLVDRHHLNISLPKVPIAGFEKSANRDFGVHNRTLGVRGNSCSV